MTLLAIAGYLGEQCFRPLANALVAVAQQLVHSGSVEAEGRNRAALDSINEQPQMRCVPEESVPDYFANRNRQLSPLLKQDSSSTFAAPCEQGIRRRLLDLSGLLRHQ